MGMVHCVSMLQLSTGDRPVDWSLRAWARTACLASSHPEGAWWQLGNNDVQLSLTAV